MSLARVVVNARPVDWNRCGQAAVATVLSHLGRGPFAESLSNDEAMDRITADFPPDVPFGLGTSAMQMRAALEHYGLEVEHVHSGWFGHETERASDRLCDHLRRHAPAIVCLDQGLLGGGPWSAHWAVALALDDHRVCLAGERRAVELALDRFMSAWRCRHLPYAHNHCALLPLLA